MGELAQRRWARLLGWFAALTLYPFTWLFPFFLGSERAYALALRGAGGQSASARLRELASALDGEGLYICEPSDGSTSTIYMLDRLRRTGRSKILHDMDDMFAVADQFPTKNVYMWEGLRELDLPFFRAGFEFYDADLDLASEGHEVSRRIFVQCSEDDTQPLKIYDYARGALLNTAQRFDAASEQYAANRLPLGLAMWSWALIELVGLSLFAVQFRAAWRHLRSKA